MPFDRGHYFRAYFHYLHSRRGGGENFDRVLPQGMYDGFCCDSEILFLRAGSCRSWCVAPPKRRTVCPKSRCPRTPPPIRFMGSWSWPDDGRDRSAWRCSRQASMLALLSLSLIGPVGASLPCTRSPQFPRRDLASLVSNTRCVPRQSFYSFAVFVDTCRTRKSNVN